MPHSIAFSSLALLAAGGAAGGVYLGRSAVAEIDPVHYSASVSSRFYSDMVPGGSSAGATGPALASAADGYGDGCVNCRTYPVEYVPQHDPSVDAFQSAYPEPSSDPIEAMLAAVDRQIAEIKRGDTVQRYASYPVEQRDELTLETAEASAKDAVDPAVPFEAAPAAAEIEAGI